MKTWVKLYTEIIDDPKMARLTWMERGIWSALLALAGRIEARNSEGTETGFLGCVEDIAWYLRIDTDALTPALVRFSELGMLGADGESWYVAHWGKRQARSPSENPEAWRDRQQKHRAVTKSEESASQDRHEDVTSLDKSRVDKSRREENAIVTRAELATTKGDPRPRPLVILTEITKWYPAPNSEPYKLVMSSVQDEPKSLERWREAVTAWVNNGNSTRNVQGMVDWYKTGKRDSRQRIPESAPPTAEEQHKELMRKCDLWALQNPKKEPDG